MASAPLTVVSPNETIDVPLWRERATINILNKCIKKDWREAESLTDDYREYCKPYWKEYDTHLNGQFNKCGHCLKMKRSLVKNKWSQAEEYPLYRQLVCMNFSCKFYLIINTDLDTSSE